MGYLVSCAFLAIIVIVGYIGLITLDFRNGVSALAGIGLGCSYSLAKKMNGDFDTDGDYAFHMLKWAAGFCMVSIIIDMLFESSLFREEISRAKYQSWVKEVLTEMMSRLRYGVRHGDRFGRVERHG